MNTPVNFELAKLLKEKEYKREEGHSYVIVNTDILNHSVGDNYISYSIGSLLKYSIKEKTIPAPTITEVVMWLHEKYRIWISVCCTTIHNKISKFHFSITFIKDLSDERNYDGDLNKIKFNSPTEAYEAAIEYTLKNLI